jgi:exopolysaccharide biosynthesis polyprenyl glycosylphosphotransferase
LIIRNSSKDLFKEFPLPGDEIVLLSKQPFKPSIYLAIKRLLDFLCAFIGLTILSPIILLVGVAIKLETPGPIFYTQERVGFNGKYFKVIKLRSMGVNAEKEGAQWAEKNDPRVTKVGSFIRKTRIDEIPQFLNVLKGEMSIIGPRPERPIFTAKFNNEIPGFINRLAVKPGVTGWAQVNGGYEITPEEKLKLDLYYIEKKSLLLDINIILKTLRVVITGEGAR